MRSRPIEDFYLAAEGDDWSLALTRAQAAMGARDVMHITFQPRLYRFATGVDIFRNIHLQGAPGCGMKIVANTTQADDWQQTVFYFATAGITLHYPTTGAGTGSYSTEPTADSNRPSISDIAFIGPSSSTGSTSFHCINAHRAFTLQNFSIYNFPGNGIHVHATGASSSITTRGNANRCHISRGYIRRCGVNGIFFDGGDSNTSVIDTVDVNDCGRNSSISTVTTSACTIVADNWDVTSGTPTYTAGVSLVVTAAASHNYVTGFYAELVQIDNATVNEDTDGDGIADYANPVVVWAAGQVTVSGNTFTWAYPTGSAPPAGDYKIRTGAGVTDTTSSVSTEGLGRVAWFTTSAATLAIGNTVTITGIDQIPTAGGTVHRVYSSPANYTGVVCPAGTLDSSLVSDPDLVGTLTDGTGSLVPFAAQIYSSSFLPNLFMNCLFGPTIQSGHYKLYDSSGKSTFLSCYSEGANPLHHFIDGSSMVIGGNLPIPNTTQRGAAFLAGDGEGRLRVVNGVEIHPEYFNNGWMIRLGLDAKYPSSNKVLTVRHSDMDMLGGQPSFLGIEYDDSHSQQGGFLDWNNTASAGSAIMLLPHAGNKRTKRFPAFPGGLQFGGAQDDNGYTNPGNPVRNPSQFGYIGFDRLGTGGGGGEYPVCLFGTGRSGIINSVTNNAGTFRITTGAADADFTTNQLGLRHIVTAVEGTTNANGHWIANAAGTATTIDLSGAFAGTYTTYTATISTVDDSTLTSSGYSTLVVTGASGTLEPGDRLSVGTADGRKDLRVLTVSGSTITLKGSIAGATGTVLKSSGYVFQAQAMGWQTAAPTTGKWSRGDVIWNFDPGTAGILGWVCTVGGESGGTWKILTQSSALTYDSNCTIGQTHTIFKAITSGGATGTADDVTIVDATTLPYAIRIVDIQLAISTADGTGGSTATLRTASAGGGSALSEAFAIDSTGVKRKSSASVLSTTAATTDGLYLRRSSRDCVGEITITYIINE